MTDLARNVAEVARREPVYEGFRNHGQKIRLAASSGQRNAAFTACWDARRASH